MNEYEVILKSLQATIGKETIRKILEQFKEIAKNNNLDRSNNLLHDVLQIVSVGVSAGVLYAISAGLDGLATIVLNTAQTKNLLLFKIKAENDLLQK